MVCCASNLHARRLQEVEQMQQEINALKTGAAGEFREESSRKRGREDPQGGASAHRDIWEAFEESMKGREFVPAI